MLPKRVVKSVIFLMTAVWFSGCVLFEDVTYDEPTDVGDYWDNNGVCEGNSSVPATVVSDFCDSVDIFGCCDVNGNALYCYEGKLYCQSCKSNVVGQPNPACSWDASQNAYWCTETDFGADPSGTHLPNCPSF